MFNPRMMQKRCFTLEAVGYLLSHGNLPVIFSFASYMLFIFFLTSTQEIISTLLNDGISPDTNRRILQKETVDLMFTNQIPQWPDFGRQPAPAASPKPLLANPGGDIYPNNNKPQGHGLSFMITGGLTGRSEGTASWAGLANLFWWADREKGIGGMISTQILPLGDMDVAMLWAQLEATVYKALT